jgi:hypothetical protein
VLNLPAEPGTTGYVLLMFGALAGLTLFLLGRGPVARALGADDRLVALVVSGALAASAAGAPFTVWRMLVDIRETAPITPEHAEYVGAETKLIDGELVRRVEAAIPRHDTYYVRVSPEAYVEIRESLARWLGYELLPRRQASRPREAAWVVAWGATPADLGLRAERPELIGRNRLSEREPVYLAKTSP